MSLWNKCLINKSHTKRFAADAAAKRAHFARQGEVRVSQEFLAKAEAALKLWIVNYIDQLPSKGKTIK